ncbi:MAG: hypothetical protein A2086_05600 [Spirochaetes bacterium GWD1_27_9]|nr:MAG: hypothetical protein A2Z98_12810 [Spirochaetes bacterium GWB1_27_13]OHD22806.1 MAG: hypothetical protein A2Y34_00230 [Spirochaetes bacterium GWC1_27_15]OHD37845.1 MAG: hypothetical protein A2086_05600 [Spirochaetes bacterium GWD1_27_9]
MINQIKIITLFVFIFSCGLLFSEDTKKEPEDKYTTMNIMLTKIVDTSKGVIIEYFAGDQLTYTYLPDDFFKSGMAVRVWEDDRNISPQANVVFKNLKPFKVKLYIPRNASSLIYRYKEFLTDEEKDKFKVTDLEFKF